MLITCGAWAPQADAATSTTVSVWSPTTAKSGSLIAVAGYVKSGGRARAYARVAIQIKRYGARSWTTTMMKTTNSRGRYAGAVRPLANSHVRALVLSKGSYRQGVSPQRAVTVKQTITFKGLTQMTAGQIFRAGGYVTPGLRGKRLFVQRYLSGRWRTLNSGVTKSNGWFSIAARTSQAGTAKIRIIAPGSASYTTVISATKQKAVYAWYYLHDLDRFKSKFGYGTAVKIGGVTYARSVQLYHLWHVGDTPYAEYNMGYKCSHFRASVGMDDDDTASGSRAKFALLKDQQRVELGTYGLGRATSKTVDIGNVLRIRVEATLTAGGNAVAGFGNARVKCRQRP